ncbi:endolytic transglycosylase MltG [Candidatus Saccharibacteria bacterium]|nr:endolytic transglycosylase MltG [Candidatus Saccharibacteria bacterium]
MIIGLLLLTLVISTVVIVRQTYLHNLRPVNASQRTVAVTIPRGASVRDISQLLTRDGLIRSSWAFEWYVRSQQVRNELEAGTYELRPSQSVSEIVDVLTKGKIAKHLFTILPAQRLDQIRDRLISAGFSPQAVDKALAPTQYKSHPALNGKPPSANLEGYLYPDSYEKTANTKPETIIRAALDEMAKHLTPDIRAGIVHQGLTLHEGVILASMVEKEVSTSQDRAQVAQVFFKRLHSGMVLGSDVTAIYGSLQATGKADLNYDSPYNTHLHKGLPVGPISNVSEVSLNAVAHPASTDFLYFVTGDDGVTYFSHTLDEHNAAVAAHCQKSCP